MSITAYEQITTAPENGPQGPPGPVFYPAGVWDKMKDYTRTNDTVPYVLFVDEDEQSSYYFLNKEGSYKYEDPDKNKDRGKYGNPRESYSENGVWELITDVGYVFTEFLMAKHALLAGAVAYDNKLFSQQGTINGTLTNKPGDYKKTNFLPNLSLDWKEGKLIAKNAEMENLQSIGGIFKDVTATGGIFEDVTVTGCYRSKFYKGYKTLSSDGSIIITTPGLQKNNHVVIPGTANEYSTDFSIPFNSDYNGFRAIILNEDFDGEKSVGIIDATAPADSGYFYENGKPSKSLRVWPNQGIELIGFGDNKQFNGWIITNRFFTSNPSMSTGYPFRVMYSGTVNNSGTLVKYDGYDNDKLSCRRLEEGKYRISFTTGFSSPDKYVVFLTGEDYSNAKYGRYASLIKRETKSFDVYTGDDATPNDAGFHFLVVSSARWGI